MLDLNDPGERFRRDTPLRPLVVLAVDDQEARATYAYALYATGFDVTTTADGATWQADAPETRPDIIVVDVSPESRHGWPLVQQLTRYRPTAAIPIVAVVETTDIATRERAQRERCAAICLKSCSADAFASGLRAVLKTRSRPTG
jgi:DNA-binding NarL/FixJ family response regulator